MVLLVFILTPKVVWAGGMLLYNYGENLYNLGGITLEQVKMNLFKRLFKKEKEIQADSQLHKGEWDFYFSNVDDIIGSFYLNLTLVRSAPQYDKPNLIWVSVNMQNPREDGLSSSEEFPILMEIEDGLVDFVTRDYNSLYAGRLTTNGSRDFYFYSGDKIFHEKAISEAMVAFPSYSFEYGIKEDREWEHYLGFMYPEERQYQSILNRRVIGNLEKGGDPLTKPRPVDHWIYFKSRPDQDAFLSAIEHMKFSIVGKDKPAGSSDYPIQLHISRIDHVDQNSVDEYVIALWDLAKKYNGEYDGWETSVEKE